MNRRQHPVQGFCFSRRTDQLGVTHHHRAAPNFTASTTTTAVLTAGGRSVRYARGGGEHMGGGVKVPPSVIQDALTQIRRAHSDRLLVHDPVQHHSLEGRLGGGGGGGTYDQRMPRPLEHLLRIPTESDVPSFRRPRLLHKNENSYFEV